MLEMIIYLKLWLMLAVVVNKYSISLLISAPACQLDFFHA